VGYFVKEKIPSPGIPQLVPERKIRIPLTARFQWDIGSKRG